MAMSGRGFLRQACSILSHAFKEFQAVSMRVANAYQHSLQQVKTAQHLSVLLFCL